MMAAQLGVRPMPWQLHAADVAGELVDDPDVPGQLVPAYSTVVLSVPRRAGKSLLMLLWCTAFMARTVGARLWYSAQSRQDAAITMRDEWVPMLNASTLADGTKTRLSNGSEAIQFPSCASMLRLFAPVPKSLHGQSGDVLIFDEAWSHSAELGAELVTAARPLMATRPGAQQWIVSAAGTDESTWLNEWVDRGRAAAIADLGRGVCHLEWCADVDGLDLDDPAVWLDTHPAVRSATNPYGTITQSWLAEEHATDADYFYRVYLNVTDRKGSTVAPPFTIEQWRACAADAPDRRDDTVTLGVAAAPDQAAAAVVACGVDSTGLPVVELIDARPGDDWIAARVAGLMDRYPISAVGIDVNGPANVVIRELTNAGTPVVELQTRDVTAAAATLARVVRGRQVGQYPHPDFDVAVEAARRRPIGDGSWTWGRRDSAADVSPLEAATLAVWVHPALTGLVPAVA